MTDLTARRIELLNAKYVGQRVTDPRNGDAGTVTRAMLYTAWGRMGWANGLHFVVKMDRGGTWLPNVYQVKFCEEE